jgi:ankyrin repeat protein
MKLTSTILTTTLSLSLLANASLADTELVDVPKDVRVNLAQPDGTTALISAAWRNDTAMVDLVLRAGADDVNVANDYGATALYVAAENADGPVVSKLLDAKADPNKALLSGETPLMQAARRGKLDVVRLLLSKGADPNSKESNGGQTALMWAISERHPDVADALIKSGADIRAKSNGGSTALMFAAQQGDEQSARLLLAAGADPNEKMQQSAFTPLIIASVLGHEGVAVQLLEKGADPDAIDRNGFASLHHAVRSKKAIGIVQALLEHGVNPNIPLSAIEVADSGVALQGATPLLLAAEINNYDAVVALAEAGADPLIGTSQNTTPLILAAGGGTDVFRPRPADERATAIKTVAFLVEKGADVNASGQFGWTALHAAAYQGLNDVVEFLVEKGAKPDPIDRFGQTPLSISLLVITEGIGAAYDQTPKFYRPDTADLLLKLGATPLERSGVKLGSIQQRPPQ